MDTRSSKSPVAGGQSCSSKRASPVFGQERVLMELVEGPQAESAASDSHKKVNRLEGNKKTRFLLCAF